MTQDLSELVVWGEEGERAPVAAWLCFTCHDPTCRARHWPRQVKIRDDRGENRCVMCGTDAGVVYLCDRVSPEPRKG